ncbi:ABC transporter permease [Lutibaculum baratangense]|uniref:Putative ABC transporter, permease protein n=1 Tax=Lutibaculum baratangense AMV1 TaxID=631454 RepID=V4TJC7_9HYPH|nr:ABC transporter permease [Lutibaculum baratangense]ESR26023.1 putative ABC transporter, permease protein [Lutibaculum baratangense AMV1]
MTAVTETAGEAAATSPVSRLPLPLRFAARELRGGLRGFAVFIVCIALGVGAIAAVGSISRALVDGISEQGQTILGGDVSVSLVHRELPEGELAGLESLGEVSKIATLRAMARRPDGETQTLVELKAVDDAYPLVGELEVSGADTASGALAATDDTHGLLAEAGFAARLGIEVGDAVEIGNGRFTLSGIIEQEPDRLSDGGIGWGPRAIVSHEGLEASGLVQPGSLLRYTYRVLLDGVASDARVAQVAEGLESEFPDAGWRVRTRDNASPRLKESIDRFSMYLVLVGLTALIVGGVGVANAVTAYVERRREGIATLKSLGASRRVVFLTYLSAILILAAGAILIGLAFGAAAPPIAGLFLRDALPVTNYGPFPGELAKAALYGLLTALAFALWPLGIAREIPARALFQGRAQDQGAWPARWLTVLLAAVVLALCGLAILFAADRFLAAIIVGSAAAIFVALRLVAWGIMAGARALPRSGPLAWRMALTAIHRPGAVTPSAVLSLGLGLTLLVAVAQTDGNLTRQLTVSLPDRAPSFFFLDIPRNAAEDLRQTIEEVAPDATVEEVPMLRGRIVSLEGVPVSEIEPHPDAAWVLRGDRGLTYAETPPGNGEIVAGSWWPENYQGEPLVSFAAELAEQLGLEVGDRVEVNVLGRTIEARIANLRKVEWESLSINFVMVFSPNTFAGAPHMVLATASLSDAEERGGAEARLMREVTRDFPTVTMVRVREALNSINDIVRQLAWAIRGASGFTLLAGIVVLGGALAASHRHRIHDAVILKTLGATRGRLLWTYVLEFGLLGLVTAAFATIAGTIAAWAVVTFVMQLDFVVFPWVALAAATGALAVTIGLGLVGTWRVLGQRPGPWLRNE